jgi:hypothetical protein
VTQRQSTTSDAAREDIFGAALTNMPLTYLQCRDLKHKWNVTRDYHLVDTEKDETIQPRLGYTTYVRRELRCTRCRKRRIDAFIIENRGGWQMLVRLNSTYDDPDGYGVTGIGHLVGASDMVRGEMYRRVLAASGG